MKRKSATRLFCRIEMAAFAAVLHFATLAGLQSPAFAQSPEDEVLKRTENGWRGRPCDPARNNRDPLIVLRAYSVTVVVYCPVFEERDMHTEQVRDYLSSLPISAWPNGRKVSVMTTDVVFLPYQPGEEHTPQVRTDQMAQWNTMVTTQKEVVKKICADLELAVTRRDGTPLK